jgi:hypothetical protein
MAIVGYWIFILILFALPGSPFASEGFSISSSFNSSVTVPVVTPTPTVLDQIFLLLDYVIFVLTVGGQILLFLILGIGLPASYPFSVQLLFSFWNFFIFVVGVGIVISIFTGD